MCYVARETSITITRSGGAGFNVSVANVAGLRLRVLHCFATCKHACVRTCLFACSLACLLARLLACLLADLLAVLAVIRKVL
jgi:hypothetical protein